MTIADGCILGAVLIYLITLAPAKVIAHREFDNGAPRDPRFYGDPFRARILGAHNNGVETFPFFAAAVLLAEFRHSRQPWVDGLAMGFLVIRLAYVAAYVGDRPTARSLIWTAGFFVNVLIFISPLLGR